MNGNITLWSIVVDGSLQANGSLNSDSMYNYAYDSGYTVGETSLQNSDVNRSVDIDDFRLHLRALSPAELSTYLSCAPYPQAADSGLEMWVPFGWHEASTK